MTRFALAGFLNPRDGYGYGTLRIGAALQARGGGDVELVDLRERTTFDVPVVAVCTPDWLPEIQAPVLIAHTMFEATQLPVGVDGRPWAELLNACAAAVVVPCAWNVDVFRANGVTRPLYVARWGVDPEDYYPIMRQGQRVPYTFLWSGTPDKRKGWDVAYRAFRGAFGDREDVRLLMHFRELPKGVTGCGDANVEVIAGLFDRPELRALLRRADCFTFPSRGEGRGLPPREAAATGLPVIATNFGGLAEEIDAWALPLPIGGLSRADYGFWDCNLGHWAEPDQRWLETLMRLCVEDPAGAATRGARAAAWLAEHGTWDRTAAALEQVVEEVIRC